MPMRPPFCPNRDCRHHVDPDSAEAAALARRKWYKRNGTYPTKVRGTVIRFKCLECGRGFSEQTFSLDYYVKRTIDYTAVATLVGSCSGVRAISRSLGCSCDSVTNRISRYARQCISAHVRVLAELPFTEDVVADGFESFTVSQYFPNNIHLLVGARSQFVFFCDYLTLRRSGRMTDYQKRMRAALEGIYRAPGQALSASFTELLDHLRERLSLSTYRPLVLSTDKKREYQRALAADPDLVAARKAGELTHQRIDSRAPRTTSNPLFAVNYIDRELRKDLAEHVRETVRFARNVNHSMERIWVYLMGHNLFKRYRINDPVALDRTHYEEAGGDRARVLAATVRLTTRRRFLSFERLEPALLRVWRREHHTPLHNAAKGVLREISQAAHSGEVDLERVKERLQIESLTVDRAQYLPKYALA